MVHVFLRVSDVMREEFPVAGHEEPIRVVGREMAAGDLDIVPIVGDRGELIGVMTERALAHRYIRETGRTHSLADAPTTVAAICEVLDGELIEGEDGMVSGRVWVHSIDATRSDSRISAGRRRRRRQPGRRPAAVDRARRRGADREQRARARAGDP